MNPKLREFERASGLEIYGLGRDRVKWEAALEKYAELIVAECGEVAYKAYWDNPETVKGIHIQEKIKEHFGIDK
jgi:hypothetical protein